MLEAATVPRRGSGRKGQTKGGAAPGEHRDATPLSNSGRGIVIAKASFDPTSQPSTKSQKPRSSVFSRPRKPRSPLRHALQGDPEQVPHPRRQIEGGVTASTAPSSRPTRNPNPNMEVAVQPNNAAPGFPSGDN